jgi:hypothetical protein
MKRAANLMLVGCIDLLRQSDNKVMNILVS